MMIHRALSVAAVCASVIAVGVTVAGSAQATGEDPRCESNGGSTICRFDFTGHTEKWTVPAGVTSVRAVLCGAAGGGLAWSHGERGGRGGQVDVKFTVQPGATYQIVAGGKGGESSDGSFNPGGFNGGGTGRGALYFTPGGGGGGRSSIALDNANLAIAGGGGGAGGDSFGASFYERGGDGGREAGNGKPEGNGGGGGAGPDYVGIAGGGSAKPGNWEGRGGEGSTYSGAGGGGGYTSGGGGANLSGGGGGSSWVSPWLDVISLDMQSGQCRGNGFVHLAFDTPAS